jgi:hypothetical protein
VVEALRETGRDVLDHACNHAEPPVEDRPPGVRFGDETYRRRGQAPHTLGTLFGSIEVRRCVYECLEPGEPCIWLLELRPGVVAGLAAPAPVERVGCWSADHEQAAVRALLRAEHGVSWSVASLRKVAQAVRDGVAATGEQARGDRLVELLTAAEQSSGKHRPALACGRSSLQRR